MSACRIFWRTAWYALGRADVLRPARFVSVQPRYNLLFRQIERELLPLAGEEGLAVIPYNPLAGGLLTGKHGYGAGPSEGPALRSAVGKAGELYTQRYWYEREFHSIEKINRIVGPTGRSLASTALAWMLASPVVTSAIIGEPAGSTEQNACRGGSSDRSGNQGETRRSDRRIPLRRRTALTSADFRQTIARGAPAQTRAARAR